MKGKRKGVGEIRSERLNEQGVKERYVRALASKSIVMSKIKLSIYEFT